LTRQIIQTHNTNKLIRNYEEYKIQLTQNPRLGWVTKRSGVITGGLTVKGL